MGEAVEEPTEDAVDFVLAARYGELDDVTTAVVGGMKVDVRGDGQSTALLMASGNGHAEVVRYLLEARANTELCNEAQNYPLHWAALNGHGAVCKVLLEAKADANIKNEFGNKAFDEAFRRDLEGSEAFKEVCETLAPSTSFADDADGVDTPEGHALAGQLADALGEDDADGAEDADSPEGGAKSSSAPAAAEPEAEASKVEEGYAAGDAPKAEGDCMEAYPEITYGAEVPERITSSKMEKKLKKVTKEGGKRGVEIEGAADMGGLQFFCTNMDEPGGDIDLLYESLKAMNAKSDPSEEERKGGSGRIGKMLISKDQADSKLALVAYCPPAKQAELKADDWMKHLLKTLGGGELVFGDASTAKAVIDNDSQKGLFVLKLKDSAITESINHLKSKGLFPDKTDDSDDEYIFGDDDFPS